MPDYITASLHQHKNERIVKWKKKYREKRKNYFIYLCRQQQVVDAYHWLSVSEFGDLVTISQMTPGPIAVNGAIVVGYKLAGISGVIVSVFGAVLPPFLIISVVSVFYEIFRDNRIVAAMLSGMQTGVGAVIISVVYEMAKGQSKKENRIELAIIMVVAFMASYVFDISVIYIILACIGVGIVQYGISRKKTGGRE